ncbi:flagellar hook-associated protein 2 [Marinospirillum celere]|uniref:Flagellar hook-associated protein 2 n=1 Tax=Marinospirillum celere TaxID=1122252 RepID=A0A1I1HA29_9GAMM|nr:flagellar filament capping protein FliD [Marinospirillum celere]SFC17970.1 flagellar hook-associated protein 2 [Marinospirillum celere]
MSGISFSGLGSGLPVDEIVQASVQARAQPLERMQVQRAEADAKISAYGQLTSKVNAFQSAMSDLTGENNYNQMRADSSNEGLFTASADYLANATSGNYNIEVESEAQNYRWVSNEIALDAELDPIEIEGVEITPGGDGTLDDLRAAINANEDLEGVSANIVNTGDGQGRLIINADETGQENELTINNSGSLAQDADLSIENDLDAVIKIDGIEATSSSNRFENVVTGVTIDITPGALNDPNASSSGVLEIDRDTEAVKENIHAFRDAYNDLMSFLNEAKSATVNDDGEVEGGALAGESVIRSLEGELRGIIGSAASSDPNDYDSTLLNLGFKTVVDTTGEGTGPRDGHLEIDDERLSEMLDNEFDEVARIFGDEDFGYASRLEEAASRMTDSTRDGLIPSRTDGLNARVDRLEDRMQDTIDRLDSYEERLYRQFNAIESVTANLNTQGQQIQQQFAGLPGYG